MWAHWYPCSCVPLQCTLLWSFPSVCYSEPLLLFLLPLSILFASAVALLFRFCTVCIPFSIAQFSRDVLSFIGQSDTCCPFSPQQQCIVFSCHCVNDVPVSLSWSLLNFILILLFVCAFSFVLLCVLDPIHDSGMCHSLLSPSLGTGHC